MPSRDFCDRCDAEIVSGDAQYSIKTGTPVKKHPEYREEEVMIGMHFKSTKVDLSMLCKKCITEILTVIYAEPL